MAQIAAYGLALTARERRAQPAETRRQDLRRSRDALIAARPTSRALAWAVGRMAAAEEAVGPEPDGDALAGALRAEADAIALRMQADLDAVADQLAAVLIEAHESVASESAPFRPLGVLLHGDPGALWGGLVGPGTAALDRFVQSGRRVRVVLTEGRPFMDGARLAAWELRQARISYQLIPDAAVAWLFDRQSVDLVVIAAEAVAANGDTAALIGSRAIADLAAAARVRDDATQPRIVVIATGTTIAPAVPDGRAFPDERRPVREVSSFLGAVSLTGADTLNPAVDTIPAERIATLVDRARPDRPDDRRRGAGGRARLMATVASGAASDRLLARATRDRDSLLAFLSRDRLYAAYAIADMDDREFARTRWGMALKDGAVVAVCMEYNGISPQPLFVMGEPTGVRIDPRLGHPHPHRVSRRTARAHPGGLGALPGRGRPAHGAHVGRPRDLPSGHR